MRHELTLRAILVGMFLAAVFGMANAYLSLRVGMTISASIPAAVMSMLILRLLFRRGTILENSLVQTIASSGESLAAGLIFTIPAFYLLSLKGYPEFMRYFSHLHIFLYSFFGGLLGVCFLIPLRKFFVEEEASTLPFPEGTACAEVLLAGDRGGEQARWVLRGGLLGAVYRLLSGSAGSPGFPVLPESFSLSLNLPKIKTLFAADLSPALLGVGYIIGLRTALLVFLGGAVGWYVIMPALSYWGSLTGQPIPPATLPIQELGPFEIWDQYLRYVGAGAVLAGGFITLFRTILPVLRGVARQFRHFSWKLQASGDLPLPLVVLLVALAAVGLLVSPLPHNLLTVSLAILLGFMFAAVSGRLTGLIGSSSNPVSGMTIASLAVICTLLYLTGYRGGEGMLLALSAGVLVCVTASMAGDAAQDLKTGQLVGNRPWVLQLGEFVGFLAPTLLISWTLFLLHNQYGLGTRALPAPQATVISLLIEGIFQRTLPWWLIGLGAVLAILVDLLGYQALAFAVGLYLPITTTTPILLGGYIAHRTRQTNRGILLSSGLVAGDALAGIGIALLALARFRPLRGPLIPWELVGLGAFLFLALWVARWVRSPSAEEPAARGPGTA